MVVTKSNNYHLAGACLPLVLVAMALFLGACVHGQTRHDYDLSIRGTLIDGVEGELVQGLHVIVKVGDEVIYDGYTDHAGELAFTYSTTMYYRPGDLRKDPVTVLFEVQAGDYGVVEVPVTFGDSTDFITLGRILLRPGKGMNP